MLDHPGAFAEAHGGPKMTQSSTKMAQNITKIALHGPKCPYMTLNGPKTLAMGILHKILSCWTTLRQALAGSQESRDPGILRQPKSRDF